jgi:hypothetical protein
LPGARVEIRDILLDHREIAAGREYLAGTRQDRDIDARIAVYVTPDLGQLAMQSVVRRVHFPVVHSNPQHKRMRAIEAQAGVFRIRIGHERSSFPGDRRPKPAGVATGDLQGGGARHARARGTGGSEMGADRDQVGHRPRPPW